MSRLDQAFIKAYRKLDQPHASPPAPKWQAASHQLQTAFQVTANAKVGAVPQSITSQPDGALGNATSLQRAPQAPPAEPQPAAPQKPAAVSNTQPPPSIAISHEYSRVDSGHTSSRPHNQPHVRLSAAIAANAISTAEPAPNRSSETPSPPIATGVADAASASSSSSASVDQGAGWAAEDRAAFEVDRFLWPDACKNLLTAASNEYRRMASELLANGKSGRKLFLVTSLRRGEGRTSLAICLAHALVQQKAHIALMEGDLGRPQLARQLKLLPSVGWDETLQAAEPVTESWVESIADGSVRVPQREPADQRNWRVDIARLEHTVELLCRQHDLLLVDCGPLDDLASRELMSWLAGAVQAATAVVVRDVRSHSPGMLDEVQQHLTKIGISRWDIVENFV